MLDHSAHVAIAVVSVSTVRRLVEVVSALRHLVVVMVVPAIDL